MAPNGARSACVIAREVTPVLEVAREMGRGIHPRLPMLTSQVDLLLRFNRWPLGGCMGRAGALREVT
jgi:hypothetical protein